MPKEWEPNPALGRWVRTQRHYFKAELIREDRKKKLDTLDFKWGVRQVSWEFHYKELLAYREKHGTTHVPHLWIHNRALGTWVSNQRAIQKLGKLSPERTKKLEAAGINWNQLDAVWDVRYQKLLAIIEEHGDWNIPNALNKDPYLKGWMQDQRVYYRRNMLKAYRIKLLEDIGFIWNIHDLKWNKQFEALVELKAKHDISNIVDISRHDQRLAKWTQTQRINYLNGNLKGLRAKQLESVGIDLEYKNLHYDPEKFKEQHKRRSLFYVVPPKKEEDIDA